MSFCKCLALTTGLFMQGPGDFQEHCSSITEHGFGAAAAAAAAAVLDVPDPNITVMKKCTVFPVEFVVRGFMTGD
jgi:phosphoribosylaminoimidazole-succinocarboxamide synthase